MSLLDIDRAHKKYLNAKQDYFDLLDLFYKQEKQKKKALCDTGSFEGPSLCKSHLEYSSLSEVYDVNTQYKDSWPDISFDDTLKAIQFFFSIESEYIKELKIQHAHFKKENIYYQLMSSVLFPKFISFFNASFAPVNKLPLNSIRPENFQKACIEHFRENFD